MIQFQHTWMANPENIRNQSFGEKQCEPALIVGMPVGFVNAAESKDALMNQKEIPYVTIQGRKGGSALAACVVNQLAEMALGRGSREK